MKWRVALAFGAVSAAFLYVMFQAFGHDPHAIPFMLRGKPAPAFSLKRLDNGQIVTLSQLRGKPVVLSFWASWCEPCKAEHPVLSWAARTFGDQAHFLGIVFEDTEENAKTALEAWGSPFPQLVDPLSGTAVDYGTTGVPETYFIDAQGIIQDKKVGPISPEELTADLKRLSKGSGAEAAR